MMGYECKELLSEPDNIEYIRDQVAAILSAEIAHQYELAKEADDPAARDYNIGVYVENDDPVQLTDGNRNPFPLVNISIASTETGAGSSSINKRNMTATFLLDVYAVGNTDGGENAGMRASLKAWKAARVVRNILGAENNSFFKMRGIVTGRDMTKFEGGEPDNKNSAIRARIVRITMEVDYVEGVAINDGEELELIHATINDEDGRVLVEF